MNEQEFDGYLKQSQALTAEAFSRGRFPEEMVEWVKQQQETPDLAEPFQEFLKGEHALYNNQPELALKHYLQAKSVPHFQFFCYRASALIAKKRQDYEKALRFAHKAIRLLSNDPLTLSVIDALPSTLSHVHESTPPSNLNVGLNENELQELDSILACSPVDYGIDLSEPATCQNHSYSANHSSELANEFTHIEPSVPRGDQPFYKQIETDQSAYKPVGNPFPHTLNLRQEAVMQSFEENTSVAFQDPHSSSALEKSWEEETEQALESRIENFQRSRAEQLSSYIQQAKRRSPLPDHALWVFNGWSDANREMNFSAPYALLTQQSRKPSSGFYLRWNGKGIVINPGKNFLYYFHQRGLHIKDIDYVIVTQSQPDTYADIKEIYDLNYQLNKVSPELQIIEYYLNQKAYLQLSSILKPNFKQERNAIHSLELFLDSPDVERVEIQPGILLNYFPTSSQETIYPNQTLKEDRNRNTTSSLGIRFDLRSKNSDADRPAIRVGYVSGTHWTPLLGHHLGHCDLLIAGFGNTNSSDFSKLNYNEDSLGYFGIYSLLEEVNPRLLLCCEFDGREGDIRLEVVRKLRNEYVNTSHNNSNTPAILPSDNGLFIDLNDLQVRCDVSQQLVNPNQLRVVKSNQAFGRLYYLSPSCLL